MAARAFTTGDIARRVGARIVGDPQHLITGLAPLDRAGPEHLAHLSSLHWRRHLAGSGAGAVLVTDRDAPAVAKIALVVSDPYLAYASASQLFDDPTRVPCGVHPDASVAHDAVVGAGARIAARATVGAGAVLGADVEIGTGAVVEAGALIGAGSRILARAVITSVARLGQRVLIHPGAVIGADGFGFARSPDGRAQRIAQFGAVVLGDDVEVGANSTIDRGSLGDTVIESGVKIDNQVQIGHNVHIGRDTIICGCVGIVGSTRIGARCVLAGGVGVGGDGPIAIADDVTVTAMTHVSRSIDRAGRYSSGTLHGPSLGWKRNALRLLELDGWIRRLKALEKRIDLSHINGNREPWVPSRNHQNEGSLDD
ncbi:MAG: UDP-3-O-(3-hydroxymyristoyl)glucosamine N-acyltransferase [Gammaproteobacteria bacterium]|nr:UDP-3-O-(3-hydroxymyristoyl)glucosamine N-acyltransferase [Gammaproteobacteria bacterium]